MSESLGKAVLELSADVAPFEKNMKTGKAAASEMERALDSIAAVANLAESALGDVKMSRDQATESKVSAEGIVAGVRGISDEARTAARELDNVRITDRQAAESDVAGDVIDRKLKDIVGNANEARRSLESVRLAGIGASGAGGGNGNPGVGVGPFGSGFGRIGVLGAGIGAGVLTGPAAAPAALGLLAAIPVLAATGAGALGTLALAFDGVGKAIGGDKKAFDDLVPAQQSFVLTVRSLDGALDKLKQTAASNLFPGLTAGLKSALSPGTLGAVTTAVTEFAKAIGAAGAAWGRYFGSTEFQSIFGPLMAAGAKNLGLMSDAALHLFDALGVLARAAIPLTQWMVQGVDTASRWADSFLHAKDATGQLGGAMNEAKTSLQLVGGLLAALGRAVGELGIALYPVAKVAVKDLTDGLNFLAGLISRNKDVIREIVSTALTGLVTAVKLVVDGVKLLNDGLQHIVSNKSSVVLAVLAIGSAIALALGPESTVILGVLLAVGLIKTHWQQVSAWMVVAADKLTLAILEPFSHLPGSLGEWARKAKNQVNAQLAGANASLAAIGTANGNAYGSSFARAVIAAMPVLDQNTLKANKNLPSYTPSSYGQSYIPGSSPLKDMAAAAAKKAGIPVSTFLAQINQESGFNPSAVSSAGAAGIAQFMPGTMGSGITFNPYNPSQALPKAAKMMAGLLAKYHGNMGLALAAYNAGSGRVDKYLAGKTDLPAETQDYVRSIMGSSAAIPMVNSSIYAATSSPFGTVPPFTSNLGTAAPKATIPTGANLLPEALRNALQKARDKVTTSQGSVAAIWLNTELADLDKAKNDLTAQLAGSSDAKKAAIQAELRLIDGQIATVNKDITANLHQQASAIKSAFASKISAAKGNITSAVSALTSALDTALGAQYYQGGAQTPLEAQLAQMQAQDTSNSLSSALSQAQAQLAADQSANASAISQAQDAFNAAQKAKDDAANSDAATKQEMQTALDNARAQLNAVVNQGNSPEQIQADKDAIVQAQRAIDENNLSIQATAQRAQADKDYAKAQNDLNAQVAKWGKGLADGTTNLSDLNGIVGDFGLTLTGDDGVVSAFSGLSTATGALSKVMVDEALALAKAGDSKDVKAIQAIADTIGFQATVKPGQSSVTSGLGGAAGFFALNPIPKLDTGGYVAETGLAVVHRGETYSGVGANRMGGVSVNVNGFVGNEAELAIQIGRVLQRANDRGFSFGIK